MKLQRTQNATRNILFGILLKLYQIVIPFILRTVMIYSLGIEYIGLNSLFTSILQVLNLAEMGVGSAMVFSMYKPIATDDSKTICALMRLYKIYYRIIGLIVLIGGIVLIPFLPYLIKSGLPKGINLYILYLLNLSATVLSYWLFAYKNCLLTAHQREDVNSKINIGISSIEYALQFLMLFVFHNYYLYLIVRLGTQTLLNILISLAADRMYPQYHAKGRLDKEMVKDINCRVRDMFTGKLGGVIVNSADSIVISSFLGLTTLAIYNNYYYILTSIIGFGTIVFGACTAGIGNSLVMETEEKNYKDLQKFTLIIAWMAGFCTCCLLCLYQPFMKIWIGTQAMFDMGEVICFCAYYFIYEIVSVLILYKDAAGMWHEDRMRPLATALTNLVLNLILVQYVGVFGILLSTVISFLIIGIPWLIYNLFTVLFHFNPFFYVKRLLYYTVIVIIACVISYLGCAYIPDNGVGFFIVKCMICFAVSNLTFLVAYRNLKEWKQVIALLEKIIPDSILLKFLR